MSVRIDDRTIYEPDTLVRCGSPLPGDAIEAPDPIIVVEVISPSSRGVDAGVKLARYFSLASVRHYLIVDTEKRIVIRHLRSVAGGRAADHRSGIRSSEPSAVRWLGQRDMARS